MPDLLLEVLSEEIPARMQAGGSDQLKKQVLSRLEEARLSFDVEGVQSFATPRRLALIVPGLPAVQPDITMERKGPRRRCAREGHPGLPSSPPASRLPTASSGRHPRARSGSP